MNFETLVNEYGLYISTFIICLAGGFIPVIHTGAFLLFISAISPKSAILPIVFIAASTQIIAKSVLYLGGSGVLKLPLGKFEQKIKTAREKFEGRKTTIDLFIFMSAFGGLPPFYVVSILAGIIKLNFMRFAIAGFVGRFLRSGLTVLFPQVVKEFI